MPLSQSVSVSAINNRQVVVVVRWRTRATAAAAVAVGDKRQININCRIYHFRNVNSCCSTIISMLNTPSTSFCCFSFLLFISRGAWYGNLKKPQRRRRIYGGTQFVQRGPLIVINCLFSTIIIQTHGLSCPVLLSCHPTPPLC